MPFNNSPTMKTTEEIRYFFAKRPPLRPDDWEAIKDHKITPRRRQQLSWFVRGYLCAGNNYQINDKP